MKKIIFLIAVFAVLILKSAIVQAQSELLLLMGDDSLVKETKDYITRVKNDEGAVVDKKFINSLIKLAKKDGYFDKISFWVSASGGLKLNNNFVDKQYDIKGNDITKTDIDARPLFVNSIAKNKPGILYDGKNDFLENKDYYSDHPLTIVLVIKQTNEMNKEAILDSRNGKSNTVYFKKGNEFLEPLVIESGKKFESSTIDTLVNVLFVEMNSKDSKVYLNGEDFGSGELSKGGFDGIILGSLGKLNKGYFLGGYIFEIGVINLILDENKRIKLNDFLTKQYK
jgi:hypothetical protein